MEFKFNVLCVTKRTKRELETHNWAVPPQDCPRPIWHLPITGEAVAGTYSLETLQKMFSIPEVSRLGMMGSVTFQDKRMNLLYIRVGLHGKALTFGVETFEHPYDIWELYSDIPYKPDGDVEAIRQIAAGEIAQHTKNT